MYKITKQDYGILSQDLKSYFTIISSLSSFEPLEFKDWLLGMNGSITIQSTLDRAIKCIAIEEPPVWKKNKDFYYFLVSTSTPFDILMEKYSDVFYVGSKNKSQTIDLLTFYLTSIYISNFNIIQLMSLLKNIDAPINLFYCNKHIYREVLRLHLNFRCKNILRKTLPQTLEEYLFENMNKIFTIDKEGNSIGLKEMIITIMEETNEKRRLPKISRTRQ